MWQAQLGRRKSCLGDLLKATVTLLIVAGCFPEGSRAQEPGQKTFSSPDAAATALVTAVRSGDEKAMLDVLGPRAKRLVSSGDAAEDADERANFVQRYDQMHRFVNEPDATTTLYIGAANWPTPIPLMHAGNTWYFDTEAGRREILYRRVGRNELSAIRVCEQLVEAEKEYHSIRHDEYAHRIFSTTGTHDGLYWNAAEGEAKSPIGPLVARAVTMGDASEHSSVTAVPFRGYYYHILTSLGAQAPGGARAYLVNGKMTGFAFVAYPAEYRSSGVMTFVVGEDGVVYQKDLGKKTGEIAKAMNAYEPDSSWQKAEAESEAAGTSGAAQAESPTARP
jgi:hypothetical protein